MGKDAIITALSAFSLILALTLICYMDAAQIENRKHLKMICAYRGAEVSSDSKFCIAKDTRVLSAIE